MTKKHTHMHLLVLAGSILTCAVTSTAVYGAQQKPIEEIVKELNKVNPAYTHELESYLNQFEQLIHAFLNPENNESFSTHLSKIEQVMHSFKNIMSRYSCVAAKRLSIALDKLLATLKTHAQQPTNSVALGLALQEHKRLLPAKIIQVFEECGQAALLSRLNHRLTCKNT